MSKKAVDTFQNKITRNDRFAQMSQQERIIEQKKKEIQAKLEAKEKASKAEVKQSPKSVSTSSNQKDGKNVFSNDGSFLNQFKQIKESKKLDLKPKSFNKLKDRFDKSYSDDRSKNHKRTSHRSPSPKDRIQKRISRFSNEKVSNLEPKITINTSFSSSSLVHQQISSQGNYQIPPVSLSTQDVTGQPLLKNVLPQPIVTYQNIPEQVSVTEAVISASPVLLNVPSPQIVQGDISHDTLVFTQTGPSPNIIVSTSLPTILTTVNLPQPIDTSNITPVPPPCLPTVELATIPAPNPIQVQNIPQPEPLNALNIPQPAPIQVQNIPTPSSLQLNKIPNPKPLDLMTIPTPNEGNIVCDGNFMKSIPPPNKSVPPPQIQDNTMSILPQQQTVTQNIMIHNMPPPSQQPTFSTVTVTLPVVVGQVSTAPTIPNNIPSLMAQPILPPPGMGMNINMTCPPPLLQMHAVGGLQNQMSFVNQPPPIANQMPMMSVPPPPNVHNMTGMGHGSNFKDINIGTPEYEAMASLGRMVAECGESIEDIVRQRKNQDPNLWYLFHKDSAAYKQYRQLIEQFKRENEMRNMAEERKPKLEEVYEPEMALEDCENAIASGDSNIKKENEDEGTNTKRKRKSRWGDQESNVAPPPTVLLNMPPIVDPSVLPIGSQTSQTPVMLSKLTRNDPGLLQYAVNTYGTTNLSEEDWKKAEDHYKISLLYQDMVKKRAEAEKLKLAGKNKYDYDSDEETDGGTWEHKIREKEMMATELWATELNKQAEGKHHIGDFLPPEELKRFMEKSTAVKEGRQPNFSDYKDFKIKEDNIGFKMLQKLGWSEGEGLGSAGTGIVEPVNKAAPREHTQGLGLNEEHVDNEDEYESYRKRMMLAYRFRPNPLNNPRRPYY
ncbi:uncharacterized protein isoform X2 [Leptinotarsa decemlineata]|uniref:uncharacterized protein isoform X2 n=1 Tax=Leptinotarsa decemlineata TaxID=7539 RepID=UPI003D309EC8